MASQKAFLDSSVIIAALLSSRGGSFYILNHLRDQFLFQINEYSLLEIQAIFRTKFVGFPELRNKLFLLLGLSSIAILPAPITNEIKKLRGYISSNDAPILASALKNSDYFIIARQ